MATGRMGIAKTVTKSHMVVLVQMRGVGRGSGLCMGSQRKLGNGCGMGGLDFEGMIEGWS